MMKLSRVRHVTRSEAIRSIAMVAAAVLCPRTVGAQGNSNQRQDYISTSTMPRACRPMILGSGDRLTKPGKERLVVTGTLTSNGGSASARIIWELPGKFRFEEIRAGGATVVFDGAQHRSSKGAITADEMNRLEALFEDTAESFLLAVHGGERFRLIGRGFMLAAEYDRNYQGPFLDLFELVTDTRARGEKVSRRKFYYFDSTTGALLLVRYIMRPQNQDVDVLTKLENHRLVNGALLPTRLIRIDNGSEVLRFEHATAALAGRVADSAFTTVP